MESETLHSNTLDHYGRGAAIDDSDIDILMQLPEVECAVLMQSGVMDSHVYYKLFEVRYWKTILKVMFVLMARFVKVAFSDGMKFEKFLL